MSIWIFVVALVALAALALFALWVWAAVDSLRRPDADYQAHGLSKGWWTGMLLLGLVVGLSGVAALLYRFVAWPILTGRRGTT